MAGVGAPWPVMGELVGEGREGEGVGQGTRLLGEGASGEGRLLGEEAPWSWAVGGARSYALCSTCCVREEENSREEREEKRDKGKQEGKERKEKEKKWENFLNMEISEKR
jgi:hypothetical protein